MSSLAHIAKLMGHSVSGSDRTKTALTERLEKEGIKISYRHDAENVRDTDVFVYTVAISPDNPEYVSVMSRGIPAVSRADFLGYVMSGYTHRIGISGSHGKSTCTSMCAHIFTAAGLDPTVVSGAEYSEMNGAYRIGGKSDFIFEACEYMDNFLCFCPSISVILNVEFDHSDYFENLDAVKDSFRKYAKLALPDGKVLVNGDDPVSMDALSGLETVTFGLSEGCDFRASGISAKNGRQSFVLSLPDGKKLRCTLSVPGRHNIYNASAALAALYLCGGDMQAGAEAIGTFEGAERRMELRGYVNGAAVYDDYAHHPTEIRATLESAKAFTKGRVICAFQSHTYSRTAQFFGKFADALSLADELMVLPIYAAREKNVSGVTGEKLAASVKGAKFAPSFEACAEMIRSLAKPDDTVIVMGAGDIVNMTKMII